MTGGQIISIRDWRRKKRLRIAMLALGLAVMGILGAASLRPYFAALPLVANAQAPGAYRVVDGDTIEAPFGVKYRLLGFDTPETFFSKCGEELRLGRRRSSCAVDRRAGRRASRCPASASGTS
jgi:endonuclease YncB( thermonuclease family)